MSSERLRETAKVLRERAEVAASPPWDARPGPIEGHWVSGLGGMPRRPVPGLIEDEDATYIATMHPGVGLALADWLDDEAGRSEMAEDDGIDARIFEPALRIADLILGGTP